MTIEIGEQVKINAPMIADHGKTGTVVNVHHDPEGTPVTAQVQLDATGEKCWLHRCSLHLLSEAAHAL